MRSEILEEMPEEMMEYFCEKVLKRDWPNCIHVSYINIIKLLEWANEIRFYGKSVAGDYIL